MVNNLFIIPQTIFDYFSKIYIVLIHTWYIIKQLLLIKEKIFIYDKMQFDINSNFKMVKNYINISKK